MKYLLASFAILLCSSLSLAAKPSNLSVASPDGAIEVFVSDEQQPHYWVKYNGKTVVEPSRLGFIFKKQPMFTEGFVVQNHKTKEVKQTWEQPWGERREMLDHHNELFITLKRSSSPGETYNVRFRAFNDGIGFRYEVPKQKGFKNIEIMDELTEFKFPNTSEATAWWIPSRGWNRYEYLYKTTPLNEVDRAHTPFTLKLKSGIHVSVHEAALIDYSAMSLDQRRLGVFEADLAPWSDGVKVKAKNGFKSSWRTLQIAPDAAGLLNSSLILNLNEPNKLGDVSWVNPGKYMGIWWNIHLGEKTWGSGDRHGATTSETKRYMDFAAKHGFDGVLVEGWNLGWDGSWYHNGDVFSFTESYPDFDLDAVSEHGKKVGVKLIGHHETSGSVTNYRNQMGDALDLYEAHGVEQIKTGYVADGGRIKRIDEKGIARYEWHDGQFMANEYLYNIKEAAKRKISINTHEPIKDTGLRRTYPNWIAREGARGQEFNAWGSPPNSPEHTAILPYTRMLSGPMDFTPGVFNVAYKGLDAWNRVQTTLTKQLALYVVLYSPIQMAADLPRHYEKHMDAFQFILDVPTDWEESRAIAGEVGDYVVFARQERGGSDWYLGALSDENARDVKVSLDFLAAGKSYIAQIYRDGPNAHWKTNPYDYIIEEKKVNAGDSLTLKLAPSGGTAIRFKQVN